MKLRRCRLRLKRKPMWHLFSLNSNTTNKKAHPLVQGRLGGAEQTFESFCVGSVVNARAANTQAAAAPFHKTRPKTRRIAPAKLFRRP